MADVAELVALLGLNIDEETWARGNELLEKARVGVEKVGEAHEHAGEKAKEGTEEEFGWSEAMKSGLEMLVGYEGIKTFTEIIEGTQEAAWAAKLMGQELGIPIQAVQELGYAAGQSNVSAQALDTALKRLSFGLDGTSQRAGMNGAAGALAKLGLSASEFKNIPVDEQLSKIADKFSKMADGSQKVAISMELFGRQAGPEMIPMLNEGGAGIDELRAKARELGVTIGDDGVDQMEKFERAQKDMQARVTAIKTEIALALTPVLMALLGVFRDVSDWLTGHQDVMIAAISAIGAVIIGTGVKAAAAWAATVAPFIAATAAITGLILVGEWLWGVFQRSSLGGKIVIGVLTGLAVVVGIVAAAQWVWNSGLIATAMYWGMVFIMEMLALGPILLIVAGVLALGALIYELVEHWDAVKEAAVDAAEWLSKTWHTVIDWIGNKIEWLLGKMHKVKSGIMAIVDAIPGVGLVKTGIGLIKGEGVSALKHSILGWDTVHDIQDMVSNGQEAQVPPKTSGYTGATTSHITVHAPVTINGTANVDAVHSAIKEHMSETIRQAHHDVRRGG